MNITIDFILLNSIYCLNTMYEYFLSHWNIINNQITVELGVDQAMLNRLGFEGRIYPSYDVLVATNLITDSRHKHIRTPGTTRPIYNKVQT